MTSREISRRLFLEQAGVAAGLGLLPAVRGAADRTAGGVALIWEVEAVAAGPARYALHRLQASLTAKGLLDIRQGSGSAPPFWFPCAICG